MAARSLVRLFLGWVLARPPVLIGGVVAMIVLAGPTGALGLAVCGLASTSGPPSPNRPLVLGSISTPSS